MAGLHPCLTGEAIVSRPEFKRRWHELRSLVSAPATLYLSLYETTVLRLMAFCQAMPQDMQLPQPYSLLSTALDTAIAALKRRRGKALPNHSNSETIAEQEALWTYAVFTAALWANWPDLQADRTIVLYKSEPEWIGLWHPVAGCLYEPKTFYKIISKPHPTMVNSTACLTSVLGKIIPAVAYRWLSSQFAVWSAWWEILTHTAGERNELTSLIYPGNTSAQVAVSQQPTASSVSVEIESTSEPLDEEDDSEPESITQETVNEKNSASTAEKSDEIPKTVDSEQALADLNQWIVRHSSPTGAGHGKKWFVRIQAGVLIRLSSLSKFIQEYSNYDSPEALLEPLASYLKKEDDQWLFRYHFVYGQVEEVVQGIILLKKGLCQTLKDFPDESQFIQGLSLKTPQEDIEYESV